MTKYYVLFDTQNNRVHAKHDNLQCLSYLRDIELRDGDTLICPEDSIPREVSVAVYFREHFGDNTGFCDLTKVDQWMRDKVDEMQPQVLKLDDVRDAARYVFHQPEHMRFSFGYNGDGWFVAPHLDFTA